MTTQLDVTKCKHYEKINGCKAYEELGLSCYCGNYANSYCPFRVEYYKAHPETYIQFGKYKYTEYKDIPYPYLAWLLKQDNLDKQVRTYIEDTIIKETRADIICNFISNNYKEVQYTRHYQEHYNNGKFTGYISYVSQDYDYGGDLFDVMQGCCGNGF